jgi:hypothetical protein
VLRNSPIVGAGHHVRAKTNTPIIGILTQPIPSSVHGDSMLWETQFNKIKDQEYKKIIENDPMFDIDEVFPRGQFIETTHVKFLESAGARIVPVDWQLEDEQLNSLLS